MIKLYIPSEDIEASTEQFLNKHHPSRSIPIPIEEIIDFQLGLKIIPIRRLQSEVGVDCCVSLDLNQFYIDQDQYENRYNRARFSLAHEVGHSILHSEYLRSLKITSIEQWKDTVLGKGKGHAPMETQANMFAGFLLMPAIELEKAFEKEKAILKSSYFKNSKLLDDKRLAPYLSKPISKLFEVSEEAATNRLLNWLNSK